MHNHYKVNGFFSWQIIDKATGQIEKKSKRKNNLILNQGLDYVAVRSFAENFTSCAVASNFSAPLLTDTGLTDEIERTSTYYTDGGEVGTTLNGNILSLTRVFDFPVKTIATPLGTIGWSYTDTPGNNLFSKSLMVDENGNPGVVLLLPGKFLRVTYTLEITLSPSTPNISSALVSGWANSDGQNQIQYLGLKKVDSDGGVSDYDAGGSINEPSNTSADLFVSNDSTALAAFGSSINRTAVDTVTANISSYTNGTYQRVKSATFGRNVGVSASLRSLGIGVVGSSSSNSAFVHVLDANQTKATDYELTIAFTYSWNGV